MYIADHLNNRIRKVTVSTSIITTIAGSDSVGYSGDNGAATSASLYRPIGVALDAAGKRNIRFFIFYYNFNLLSIGNVYIADLYNQRIRKVTVATGIITTIAGTGTVSYSGDNGAATSASLCDPYDVSIDLSGTTFHFIVSPFILI